MNDQHEHDVIGLSTPGPAWPVPAAETVVEHEADEADVHDEPVEPEVATDTVEAVATVEVAEVVAAEVDPLAVHGEALDRLAERCGYDGSHAEKLARLCEHVGLHDGSDDEKVAKLKAWAGL